MNKLWRNEGRNDLVTGGPHLRGAEITLKPPEFSLLPVLLQGFPNQSLHLLSCPSYLFSTPQSETFLNYKWDHVTLPLNTLQGFSQPWEKKQTSVTKRVSGFCALWPPPTSPVWGSGAPPRSLCSHHMGILLSPSICILFCLPAKPLPFPFARVISHIFAGPTF